MAIDKNGLIDGTFCLNHRLEDLRFRLNYAFNFMETYNKFGFFGLTFSGKYSHDDHQRLSWTDEILFDFLVSFKENQELFESTILILFADHGPRFGKMRTSIKGLLNERNPFVSIYLPKRFRERYERETKNLNRNQYRLTTPMDIHATFEHLIHLESNGLYPLINDNRSLSLFSELPTDRTCSQAGIDTYWCSCMRRSEVMIDQSMRELTKTFVNFMNQRILAGYESYCHQLELKNLHTFYLLETIINPKQQEINNEKLKEDKRLLQAPELKKNYQKFIFQFETSPNDGIYEISVEIEMNMNLNYIEYEPDMDRMIGRLGLSEKKISRLNKYGNASLCIEGVNADLRKYCYCRH